MSLSPFDSFQSRFVTYLLNRTRIFRRVFAAVVRTYITLSYIQDSGSGYVDLDEYMPLSEAHLALLGGLRQP